MIKVTVIIPAYNCAKYIKECIESILAQRIQGVEIIVVDDGSTDNTKELLVFYVERKFIRYIYQKNSGPGSARNTGIKAANGEYIAFLDADDKWIPGSIEKRCNFLDKYAEVFLVFGDYYLKESDSDELPKIPHLKKSRFLKKFNAHIMKQNSNEYVFENLFNKMILTDTSPPPMLSSMIIRHECLNNCGYFNEKIMYGEGTHFFLKIASKYPVGYLDVPLWIYNHNRSRLSKSQLSVREEYSICRWISLLEELKPAGLVKRKLKKRISRQCFDLGYLYYKQNHFNAAKKMFEQSVIYNLLYWKSYLYLFILPLKISRLKKIDDKTANGK